MAVPERIRDDVGQMLSTSRADVGQTRDDTPTAAPGLGIRVVATFTADPLRAPLEHVLSVAGIGATLEFAGYGQVFQELIRPEGMLATNRDGLNLILVRLEDWTGVEQHSLTALPDGGAERQNIARNAHDFVELFGGAAARSPVPLMVCLCPESAELHREPNARHFLEAVGEELCCAVEAAPNGYFLSPAALLAMYPVDACHDAAANRIGHIPYTSECYAALALAVARRVHRLRVAPHKVIVLDLDNTLWTGVAGEDGVEAVVIDEHRRFLQEFMLAQQKAGVVLCICSKNNEDDAWAVFDRRTDMVLKPEHFVAHRINWEPKSANLRSLALELNLGLDSVIFVDDDPAVCADVRHNCPDVAVVQLPEDSGAIPPLLGNLWLFDRPKVTKEDAGRTEMYRQNAAREQVRRGAADLSDFLASLRLEINVESMRPEQLARVSQLTIRTNQFNFTTIRRSETELAALLRDGALECAVTTVKDRFGDYGLVGVALYRVSGDRFVVDSFMMSCRVLGRGVEQRMVAHLGAVATERQLRWVDLEFMSTAKNRPALEFLTSIPESTVLEAEGMTTFRLEASYARRLDHRSCAPIALDVRTDGARTGSAGTAVVNADALLALATDYRTPSLLMKRLQSTMSHGRTAASQAPPCTPTEVALAAIWSRALQLEGIGVHDNFFDLGGDSLRAVGVLVEIEQAWGRDLGLSAFIEAQTIARMAALLDDASETPWSCLVPIQPSGSRLPLYCMHAAGGSVLFYKDLARHLGPDQPVYGLQAQGLSKVKPWHRRVEDMAAWYLEEIRAVQPAGPYRLAGSSFGGVLAYEMARQLEMRGESVDLLAMFDTYGPGYPRYPSSTGRTARRLFKLVGRVQTHWHNIALLDWRGRHAYVLDRAQRARRNAKRRWRRRRNALAAEYHNVMGRPIPAHLMQTQNAILEALSAYQYPSFAGRITLFRATHQPVGAIADRELGWTGCAAGGIDVHDVEGHHGAVTVDPHAVFLARALDPFL